MTFCLVILLLIEGNGKILCGLFASLMFTGLLNHFTLLTIVILVSVCLKRLLTLQ